MTIAPSLLRTAETLYSRLSTSLNIGQDALLLALRLYWGWQFFQTGKGKLMNLDRTIEYFTSLNIPLPTLNAVLAGSTECIGGILLLIGLGSRIISLQLIAVMIVAYLTAEIETVQNLFVNPDDFTSATPFLFLLTSLIVALFGAGRFSLDNVIANVLGNRRAS